MPDVTYSRIIRVGGGGGLDPKSIVEQKFQLGYNSVVSYGGTYGGNESRMSFYDVRAVEVYSAVFLVPLKAGGDLEVRFPVAYVMAMNAIEGIGEYQRRGREFFKYSEMRGNSIGVTSNGFAGNLRFDVGRSVGRERYSKVNFDRVGYGKDARRAGKFLKTIR